MLNVGFEVLGWVGTALAIAMFTPQVIKTVRTKETATLSRLAFNVGAFGACMWTILGASIGVWQSFACNVFIMGLMLIIFYYMYEKKGQRLQFLARFVLAAGVVATAVSLGFALDGEVPAAVNYVFVALAGAAVSFSFAPQIRRVIVNKDFQSFSAATSAIMAANAAIWTVYWSGLLAHDVALALPHEAAVAGISIVFSFIPLPMNLAAIPFYFVSKKKTARGAEKLRAEAGRS